MNLVRWPRMLRFRHGYAFFFLRCCGCSRWIASNSARICFMGILSSIYVNFCKSAAVKLGREVRCPRCGTTTVVTAPGEPSSAPPARSGSLEVELQTPGRSRPPARREEFAHGTDMPSRRADGEAAPKQNGAALGLGIASL